MSHPEKLALQNQTWQPTDGAVLTRLPGEVLFWQSSQFSISYKGNGMHSPEPMGNSKSGLPSIFTFLNIPHSPVLVLGTVSSAKKTCVGTKGSSYLCPHFIAGRFEVPRGYVIYMGSYCCCDRAEASVPH